VTDKLTTDGFNVEPHDPAEALGLVFLLEAKDSTYSTRLREGP
jgi:hypothetical protein